MRSTQNLLRNSCQTILFFVLLKICHVYYPLPHEFLIKTNSNTWRLIILLPLILFYSKMPKASNIKSRFFESIEFLMKISKCFKITYWTFLMLNNYFRGFRKTLNFNEIILHFLFMSGYENWCKIWKFLQFLHRFLLQELGLKIYLSETAACIEFI